MQQKSPLPLPVGDNFLQLNLNASVWANQNSDLKEARGWLQMGSA
ncbi:MAG: hypothetical protein NQ081_05260 [Enterobacter cloacae]|nr:hypothetical protein [Enterobacter cloacae]